MAFKNGEGRCVREGGGGLSEKVGASQKKGVTFGRGDFRGISHYDTILTSI